MTPPIVTPISQLSNYLTVLAVEIAGQVVVYQRSSVAAYRAYLTAGAKLIEAREATRHGQWMAFLDACGIGTRTARNMMTLARSGLSAEEVTAMGGVRGAIEALRETAKAVLGRVGPHSLAPADTAKARRHARQHLRDCVVRQEGLCAICQRLLPGDLGAVHVDHQRPLAVDGSTEPDNLCAVHASCNLVKGARDFYPTGDT